MRAVHASYCTKMTVCSELCLWRNCGKGEDMEIRGREEWYASPHGDRVSDINLDLLKKFRKDPCGVCKTLSYWKP